MSLSRRQRITKLRERGRKLRDVRGRYDAEAATFLTVGDQLLDQADRLAAEDIQAELDDDAQLPPGRPATGPRRRPTATAASSTQPPTAPRTSPREQLRGQAVHGAWIVRGEGQRPQSAARKDTAVSQPLDDSPGGTRPATSRHRQPGVNNTAVMSANDLIDQLRQHEVDDD